MKTSKLYPWFVVALLWGVALLNYMDRQMLSTMKEAMQVDITALQSAVNFGHLMAVFLWIYGLMSPVSGIVADRMNRKWLIVGSLFVWSSVTFLMGEASSFSQIFWLRALMGVSEALYIPAGLSLIADYHSEKTRSLAVGIHMTGHRRIWSHRSGLLYVADHFPLVRHHRYRLCLSADSLSEGKESCNRRRKNRMQ